MKSFLSILTFLVVLDSIFSPNYGLQCHSCHSDSEKCFQVGGGNVTSCSLLIKTNPVACYTIILDNGTFSRGCLDKDGAYTCLDPDQTQYQGTCHMCEENACNNETYPYD